MDVLNFMDTIEAQKLAEMNEHLMVGGGTPGPYLVKGKGVNVEDINGKSYIDCTSQSWALYLGYANDEIRETANEHMKSLSHVHQGFGTKSRTLLADKLASLAPKGLNRVSFTVGGGPAIEAAMKIAMKNIPGAQNFISLWDAYHGSTLTTAGASWISTKAGGNFTGSANFLPNLNNNFIRVPNPYCYRCYFGKNCDSCDLVCAEMMRHQMQKGVNGKVAGVIVEPIQASGGQIVFPERYLKRVREICDEFETLLIFDEIQTYCRIGKYFAADYFGVSPDIIVLGKALGAGLPIAAIIIHDRLKGFEMKGEELHTFANNSASQVAALKQLEIIERDNILENVNNVGAQLRDGLLKLQKTYPQIGDVRQAGLHIGAEMIAADGSPLPGESAMKIRENAMAEGIILGTGGYRKNLLKFKPPLICSAAEAGEILERFEKTLEKSL